MHWKPTLCALSIALLSGCTSNPEVALQPAGPLNYLHDEVFPNHREYAVESEEAIFSLDETARAFVRNTVDGLENYEEKMQVLVDRIFDHSQLNLLYASDANTTASQTFHNRAANCLSMSIMTYALAQEAGFKVRFRDVHIPEYWSRREGQRLLSGHLNLVLLPPEGPDVINVFVRGRIVDFDPQPAQSQFPRTVISRDTVLAMFYNNKGVDALIDNDLDHAYAYFRAGAEAAPHFDPVWVNLGYLYRLKGEYQYAEQSYQQALGIDPDNSAGWENLARLYRYMDRIDEADAITERIENKRLSNPHYHLMLGDGAYESRQHGKALEHYRRALTLDGGNHETHFALAKVYFQLGSVERSENHLRRAMKASPSAQERERYEGKLSLIASQSQSGGDQPGS